MLEKIKNSLKENKSKIVKVGLTVVGAVIAMVVVALVLDQVDVEDEKPFAWGEIGADGVKNITKEEFTDQVMSGDILPADEKE
jgi:energy-converting hydrogenase Eha subunit A